MGYTHWTTPSGILVLVRSLGVILLDPFSNLASAVNPLRAITPPEDALTMDWVQMVSQIDAPEGSEQGVVYCNPPYGPFLGSGVGGVAKGLVKIVDEGLRLAACGLQLVALLPAKTDARWWHYIAERNTCGLFWSGRLSFGNAPPGVPGDRPGGANYVAYFGESPGRFVDVFGPCGIVLKPIAGGSELKGA